MGSGVWLRLLLTLGALWGLGAREIVMGILGQATLLKIPLQFQQLTRQSREATWKKIMEEPQKKKFLLKISGRNYTQLEPDRMHFHENDFSLEILNTTRDDQRLYEYSVSNGGEEEVWEIQLEVFEPVSHPNIHVLHRELSNGSCWLALRCSSERGDDVSYSWDSGDNNGDNSGDNGDDNGDDNWDDNGDNNGTGGICSGSGAFLNLSYPVRSAAFGCVCTASNAVSNRSAAFDAAQCGLQHQGGPRVRTELLWLLVPLGVIVIVVIVTVRATRVAKGDQDTSQTTPDTTSATIYAQVQKPKAIVPKATPMSCTTIYAAATGPLPAPDGAPRSPAGSPTPRGHSPLSQEPTTVYASVTLPVA